MITHTLTHNASSYGLTAILVLSLGSFNIARHMYTRWLKKNFSFIGANALVKGSIVLFGLVIIPVHDLVSHGIFHNVLSFFIGIAFGLLTIYLEVLMIRRTNRNYFLSLRSGKKYYQHDISQNKNVITTLTFLPKQSIGPRGIAGIRKSYTQYASKPEFLCYSLTSTILLAISEEFLFRGYLVILAFLTHSLILSVLMIALSALSFSFSHVSNSWREFTCKLPLSIFASISMLMTGTLTGSIVTHVFFNIYAYQQAKKYNEFQTKEAYLSTGVIS